LEKHGPEGPPLGLTFTEIKADSRGFFAASRYCGAVDQGKNAVKWTKLSCRTFKDNQMRMQLFALAYNLANFLRRLALPQDVEHWSLMTLREKLVKIGAKVARQVRQISTGRGGGDAELVCWHPRLHCAAGTAAAGHVT